MVLKDIINQDLKKIGKAALPDDVNRTTTTIKGPVVLQISAVTDVSRPSTKETAGGGGADRLLSLRLTDGKLSCKAVEYQRVDQLSVDLAPGTKVVLSNATVKNGILMLNPKTIKVLCSGRAGLLLPKTLRALVFCTGFALGFTRLHLPLNLVLSLPTI